MWQITKNCVSLELYLCITSQLHLKKIKDHKNVEKIEQSKACSYYCYFFCFLAFKSQHLISSTMAVASSTAPKPICNTCGFKIRKKGFLVNNELYCEMDYKRKFSPRCDECSDFIFGVSLSNSIFAYIFKSCIFEIQDCIRLQHGMSFHPSCLRCIRCSMAIMSGEKLYMHNDNPLCRVCIAAVRSKQCFACGGAISAQQNRGLQALGKHFHVKCFLCSVRIIS